MDKITKSGESGYQSESLNHLLEMIADVKVAMLTTIEKDESLRSRPMMTQDSEFDGTIWFFTSDHDGKAEDLGQDPRVNLSYSQPDKQRYVSVSGLAEVIRDEAKKQELWSEVYRAWYPKGIEDPSLALMRVYVDKAEYWDAPSSRFVEVVGYTKALFTGKRYSPDDGHEKIVFETPSAASQPSM